ncbi:MAG: type II toxin-antitoxin system prevent-host-death family antitoxin [Ignavibacteria bacterium]
MQVNIHEAKTKLSKLIQKALEGEEIIIAKNHQPIAKLIGLPESQKKREIGKGKGKVKILKDFDNIPEGFEGFL